MLLLLLLLPLLPLLLPLLPLVSATDNCCRRLEEARWATTTSITISTIITTITTTTIRDTGTLVSSCPAPYTPRNGSVWGTGSLDWSRVFSVAEVPPSSHHSPPVRGPV